MKSILIAIALFVSIQVYSQRVNLYDSGKEPAIAMTLGGVSFTVASILQGGYQYGTWVKTPTAANPGKQTYVIPPFHKQTTRFVTCFVGVTLTITGLIGLKD